jgi:hypothetical protein
MNKREPQVDIDAERSGRQVQRDFALVNLRRVTVGTGAAAAGLVGLISTALYGQAAAIKPVARVLPAPTAAVVVVQFPVAVPVIVRVPVYIGGATGGSRSVAGTASRASGPAPAPAPGAPAPAPVVVPPPPPPPACTSSPSLCPK